MQHQLISEQLNVLINCAGAEICSVKNKRGTEYIWGGNAQVWARHAPVLFPIVGRLKNDVYTFNGSVYHLGQHGFARDTPFELVKKNETSCVFELCATPETRRLYPFDFNLQIGYELKGSRIYCTYTIKNPSGKPLIFSIGAHPGFYCPLGAGEKFEDYYLEFEHDTFMKTILEAGLRLGTEKFHVADKKLFLSESLFDNDALVFENNQVNKVSLRSSRSGYAVTVGCAGWPYFGIWGKKGNSEFICLEPWYGIADKADASGALEQKTGIITLAPQKDFNCSFWMEML
ncbi:MAG TPA: aldose 1-epimerase family protein [Bacteroidia bacterium]|nr:aldose 1-epimerase family protein [Bacteroidia bacterium]